MKSHHVEVARRWPSLPDLAQLRQEAFEPGDLIPSVTRGQGEGQQHDLRVEVGGDQLGEGRCDLAGLEPDLVLDHEHGPMHPTQLTRATSEGTQAESLDDLSLVAVVDGLHCGLGRWPGIRRHRGRGAAYPLDVADPEAGDDVGDRALGWTLFGLVVLRLAYHATYLGEVPFALGTFSDGALYEAAALDIVEHPPLGTAPFYLQGAYAYLLALGMSIRPWPAFGLLAQLLLAALALLLAHRSFVRLHGPRCGRVTTIVLLLCPALAFYENKFLSAELGVATGVLALAAFVALARARPSLPRALALGAASGLAMLARPNMLLALPFTLLALDRLARDAGLARAARAARAAAFVLGTALALAPMAARNLAVTGHPDLGPVHGGGTAFYIGNHAGATGLWHAGGLLSANVGTERRELVDELDIDPSLDVREQSRAVGDALYHRSLAWIAAQPGAWLQLELRKLWMLTGNQELTQDYDWLGEQELIAWAHRVALPFGLLLALAWLGGVVMVRRRSPLDRALGWWLAGQLLAIAAANLLFFTSAQHRLPLVVPLALLAGPGLVALLESLRSRLRREPATQHDAGSLGPLALGVALLIAVQAFVPRSPRTGPHPVHYFNLALVQDDTGDPRGALDSLDRAIALRPGDAIFHGRRAHLRFRLADLDGAEQDLAIVFAKPDAPAWVVEQARLDRASVEYERRRLAPR